MTKVPITTVPAIKVTIDRIIGSAPAVVKDQDKLALDSLKRLNQALFQAVCAWDTDNEFIEVDVEDHDMACAFLSVLKVLDMNLGE